MINFDIPKYCLHNIFTIYFISAVLNIVITLCYYECHIRTEYNYKIDAADSNIAILSLDSGEFNNQLCNSFNESLKMIHILKFQSSLMTTAAVKAGEMLQKCKIIVFSINFIRVFFLLLLTYKNFKVVM